MDVYKKLEEMGLSLPQAVYPKGIYKPVKQVGSMLFVSGQTASIDGEPAICGRVGAERTIDEGREAARLCTINALSQLENHLGDLNKIKGLVKTLGFVASAPDFYLQREVIDGASELLRDLFGEDAGVGTRSSIGTSMLSGNVTVEIEFIFEI